MKITNKVLFVVILLVSIVLRTLQYARVKFTHDEFSALSRLHFTNFSDLIEYGVKVDGHPAGVHVLLYYWGKCFGYSEMSLKFPFLLMGIGAVILTYSIGKRWFNQTVGLLSMAFVATIQFSIAYSVIARPYISGLFTSLLTVYFLTRLLERPEKSFWKYGIAMSISIALSAYNHHFSLLFTAIVGVTGWVLVKKEFKLRYILLGLLAFILYIPGLPVFFYQLSMGGVEQWLGKPDATFMGNFLFYLIHHSWYMVVVLIALLIWAIVKKKAQPINWKTYIVFTIWFMLPFLIGYYYSIYRLAVLQFSMLIFSFTFLVYLLFGYLKELSPKQNLFWMTLIMAVNIFTLVSVRKHYQYYHKSVYLEILQDSEQAHKRYKNVSSLIFSHERITKHYLKNGSFDAPFDWDNFETDGELKDYLEAKVLTSDYLFFGAISQVNPHHIPLIQLYFPYLIQQNDYFDGSTYLFSKNARKEINPCLVLQSNPFEKGGLMGWSNYDASHLRIAEGETNSFCQLSRDHEWGPLMVMKMDASKIKSNDYLDVLLKAKSLSPDSLDVHVIMEIRYKDSLYSWTGTDLNSQLSRKQSANNWNTFVHSLKLSDAKVPAGSELVVYIWNKGKQLLHIDDFIIRQRKGNSVIYGIVEPLY